MLMQFVSVMIISRLLSPAEIGIYSLAAGTIVIGQMLRDFGLSLYLVQEKDLTDEKVQSCFTISLILCWSIALVYYLAAGAISTFVRNPEVEFLVQVLALNFLMIPFGTFTLSLLRREMRFDKIMFIDVSTTTVRAVGSVLFALAGYGVLSLAYASVLGAMVTVLLSFFYTQRKHYRFNFSNIKEIAKFSSFVSGTNIISELRNTIPEIIIGRNISTEAVAYFSKAMGTMGLFAKLINQAVGPVIQPYIAKINRDNGQLDYPIYYITNVMLALQWPFCVFMFLFAEEVIYLLYGAQWGETVPILRVFAVLYLLNGFTPMWDQLLNTVGKVQFIFRNTIMLFFIRTALVIVLIDYGIYVVTLSFVVLPFIKTFFMLPEMIKAFGLNYSKLVKIYWTNLSISLLLFGMFWGLKQTITISESMLVATLVYAVMFGFSWFMLLHLYDHALARKIWQILGKKKV